MIRINYRDSRPIYEQVMDSFRNQIISGEMKKDDKLPSVRELEHEGYIYTAQGKGCFVAEVPGADSRIKELKEKLKQLISELKFLGVRKEEVDDYWN